MTPSRADVGLREQGLKTAFTVHKQIYSDAKRLVSTIVHQTKSRFLRTQIVYSSPSEHFFSVCHRLSAREKSSPLPTTLPTLPTS